MEFSEKIKKVSERSKHALEKAETEEATKTSVVMPFIQALGFDVFDLNEVVPEFTADVGTKKGEKVDFAIKINGVVSILVEVKPVSTSLGKSQYNQLFRYFSTTSAKLAILTNGIEYWFFSDLDESNKLDKSPFFIFDMMQFDAQKIEELSGFCKNDFDVDRLIEAASNLRYQNAAAEFLQKQLAEPDDDFVKFIGRQIYEGSITKAVVEQLRPVIQSALESLVKMQVSEKFGISLDVKKPEKKISEEEIEIDDGIETTKEEIFAYQIIMAICSEKIDVERVILRDSKTYCSIIIDDNNRKPLCRLYFNAKKKKRIGIFDNNKNEDKIDIEKIEDIFKYKEKILETALGYGE